MKSFSKPLFLLSLPRSGSTLCQRILSTHKEIVTVNEPHILLPLFYMQRERDVYSTYHHFYSAQAIQDFCQTLPNKEADFYSEIRQFALNLYKKAAPSQAKYFLDKTPKYNLVADDLLQCFPDAKFIFLWRNPLSIAASINDTWAGGHWNIHYFEVDLFQGLPNLVDTYSKYADQVCAIKYEDIVLQPKNTWKKVFDYLELPFDPQVLTDFSQTKLEGRVVDPYSNLDEYQVLRQEPLQKWKKTLANPLRKSWARHYLRYLGNDMLQTMGYELDELLAELDSIPVSARFLFSDLYERPLGAASRMFELPMMLHKYRSWRKKQRIYLHG